MENIGSPENANTYFTYSTLTCLTGSPYLTYSLRILRYASVVAQKIISHILHII